MGKNIEFFQSYDNLNLNPNQMEAKANFKNIIKVSVKNQQIQL